MRKVNYNNKNYAEGNGKRNAILISAAIVLLLAVFFLSFIVAYNIMFKTHRVTPESIETQVTESTPAGTDALDDTASRDVAALQEKIEELTQQIDVLNAQVEKYKAQAEMRSGTIPSATQKPPASTSAPTTTAPPAEASPSPSPTKTPATPPPAETPKTETPEPASTQEPPATVQTDDGVIDGI
jgi:TolA-binding protein